MKVRKSKIASFVIDVNEDTWSIYREQVKYIKPNYMLINMIKPK
jgi:hypothetical protein